MNNFMIDFVDDITGLVLETRTIVNTHLTSRDFKNMVSNLCMYAVIGKEWCKLTAYVYKNTKSCFCIECRTISDGNAITADIIINSHYLYTKTLAC